MFRDELTGENSKPGQKGVMLVTETREKYYTVTKKAPFGSKDADGNSVKEVIEQVKGFEIVKEILVLPETAERYLNETKPRA